MRIQKNTAFSAIAKEERHLNDISGGSKQLSFFWRLLELGAIFRLGTVLF